MRLLPALFLLAFGCDGPTNPNNMNDLTYVPPPDLSMKAGGSMSLTGDNASGYTPGATLTLFNCTIDPSFGAIVSASVPNNFPTTAPAHGDTLTLQIFNTGMWIVGGSPAGNIYYQSNGLTNNASALTGTINNVTMTGQSSSPGTVTADGSWKCP
jgi:hypothetical protein